MTDETRLRFRISRGDRLVGVRRLTLTIIKLGSGPSAHLRLEDEAVSPMHALIEVGGPGDVSILDLGSQTGTFVNGARVNKARLEPGDTIVVGATRLELAIDLDDGSDPRPSVPMPEAPGGAPPDAHMAFMFSLHKLGPMTAELTAAMKRAYDELTPASTTAEVASLIRTHLLPAFDELLAGEIRLTAFVDARIEAGVWAPSPHLGRVRAITEAYRTARDRYADVVKRLEAWELSTDDVLQEMSSIALALADALPA